MPDTGPHTTVAAPANPADGPPGAGGGPLGRPSADWSASSDGGRLEGRSCAAAAAVRGDGGTMTAAAAVVAVAALAAGKRAASSEMAGLREDCGRKEREEIEERKDSSAERV